MRSSRCGSTRASTVVFSREIVFVRQAAGSSCVGNLCANATRTLCALAIAKLGTHERVVTLFRCGVGVSSLLPSGVSQPRGKVSPALTHWSAAAPARTPKK